MVVRSMVERSGKLQRELLSVRDTVESIWVAIILAFILRAFMVEAFVIPTGSMAPRLLGQHYDLQCPSCGWEFAYTTPLSSPSSLTRRENPWRKEEVLGARCPNCGKGYEGSWQFANGGDRVLVMKFLYNFSPPRPWDVVVFRNPQDNEQNYIKRLIGVPGETIQIVQGDVFVKADPGDRFFEIRRKNDPHVQEAMWQVVYDNDYRPDAKRLANPRTPRWSPVEPENPSWDVTAAGGRSFRFAGSGAGAWQWIRFGADPDSSRYPAFTRELFLPYYGYNPYGGEPAVRPDDLSRLHYRDVCSDLKLSVRFTPDSAHSHLAMATTSFRNAFRADVSADGTVRLFHAPIGVMGVRPAEGEWRQLGEGQCRKPLGAGQGFQVALTHTDYRVTVWIDGQAVVATGDRDYTAQVEQAGRNVRLLVNLDGVTDTVLEKHDYYSVEAEEVPTPTVELGAWGGPCRLEHVQLYRDVYYTGARLTPSGRNPEKDPEGTPWVMTYAAKKDISPGSLGWGVMGNPITLQKDRKPYPDAAESDADLASFFVLGDNSPSSLDSRAWIEAAITLRLYARGDAKGANKDLHLYQLGTVPRYNMIGKALFVYWPSGHRLPGLPALPILPNVGRMRLVR